MRLSPHPPRPAPPRSKAHATPSAGRLCASLLLTLLTACQPSLDPAWQGYVEADFVRVASALPGTLLPTPVPRGSRVQAGQTLFQLESAAEQAAETESQRRVEQLTARLDNLRKGRRPSELEALEARATQARTTLALHEAELTRRERLARDQVVTASELDQARSLRDSSRAQLDAATAELATAHLGARDDEIRAAEAELAAAAAALERSRWALAQKTRTSPADALVHDTLFEPGEFVPAGHPVVSLIPPANLHIRFFVPEPALATLPVGAQVHIHADGLPHPIPATIRHRSTQPEFTPPVIYSRQARYRLVYRIEASLPPESTTSLHPGQPVDVRPTTPPSHAAP